MDIFKMIKKKEMYIKIIDELISIYMSKYFEQLNKKYPIEFKHKLLNIRNWTDTRVEKEFGSFIKWCKIKKHIDESFFKKVLERIVSLSTSIIVNKEFTISKSISVIRFFYKCIKQYAKKYYNEIDLPNSIVESILEHYTPYKDTFKLLEYENDNENEKYQYTFEKVESNNFDEIENEREDTTGHFKSDSLQYLSSDNFEHEYYNSDNNINVIVKEPEIEIKRINLNGINPQLNNENVAIEIPVCL